MTALLLITEVQFAQASAHQRNTGLLGFIRCVVGDTLGLDGITLRRSYVGDLTLSFPERRSKDGKRHPIVRPLDEAARQEIERQILDQLREQGVLP